MTQEADRHIFSKGKWLVVIQPNVDGVEVVCTAYEQKSISKLPKDIQQELAQILAKLLILS